MAESTVSYKCPNCGAPLSFMPGKKTVTCQFCNTEFEAAKLEEKFRVKNDRAAHAFDGWAENEIKNFRAFTCSSCGAELVCDENTMATECVYCGNPTMIPKRFDGMLRPDFIIPFKKTKEDAIAALKKFYKGKYLLPNDFMTNNRVEAIQAMYVPFWLFDAKISANVDFLAAKVRTRRRRDLIGKYELTEKKFFSCHRAGTMSFSKVPVDGSKKMDDDYMDSIEPFKYDEMVPFNAAYLAGYLADKFDVDAGECKSRAVERVENSTIDRLRAQTLGEYEEAEVETSNIEKKFDNVSYAMVPVWILTTRYKGKPYTFMMNGQTGKVVGDLPKSTLKSIIYPVLASLASLPLFYFFGVLSTSNNS